MCEREYTVKTTVNAHGVANMLRKKSMLQNACDIRTNRSSGQFDKASMAGAPFRCNLRVSATSKCALSCEEG